MSEEDIRINSRKQLYKSIIDMRIYKKITDFIILENFGIALGDPVLNIGSIVAFLSLIKDGLNLLKQHLINYWNNYNLGNSYHDSEEYKILKTLYADYIKRIALYFKKIGLNDPILIGDYFTALVKYGGLSISNEFSFKNVKDAASIKNNLLGANIVLGEGCCRHLAPLLSDIYKEMGFESKSLLVRVCKKNFISISGKILKIPNHMVVLVKTYKGYIIVDPANNVFGNINNKGTNTKKLISLNKQKQKYKFILLCSFDGDFVLDINDDFLIKQNNRILTEEEVIAITKLAAQVKQRVPVNEFKEKNKELIKELASIVKKINS